MPAQNLRTGVVCVETWPDAGSACSELCFVAALATCPSDRSVCKSIGNSGTPAILYSSWPAANGTVPAWQERLKWFSMLTHAHDCLRSGGGSGLGAAVVDWCSALSAECDAMWCDVMRWVKCSIYRWLRCVMCAAMRLRRNTGGKTLTYRRYRYRHLRIVTYKRTAALRVNDDSC